MAITLINPVEIKLENYSGEKLERLTKLLTYTDQKIEYELRKLKGSKRFYIKIGKLNEWTIRKEELENNLTKCLLTKEMTCPSGLADMLCKEFGEAGWKVDFTYPLPKSLPWANIPKQKDRYYQTEAFDKLIEIQHGAVSIATGGGKSAIIRKLTHLYNLKTVVMTPSVSIAKQILKDFQYHFGKKHVGAFFEGKKEYNKLFTVAVAASLTRIEKDTPEYKALSKTEVFIADESHLTPANTLADVCFGLVRNAPYRFFLSGTQIRGDGKDLLLEGIIGKIVYTKTVKELVDEGFLAKPIFRMVETSSSKVFDSKDANEMTREHLYYNQLVNEIAGEIACKSVELLNQPVLILVEEVEQVKYLLPYLGNHKVGFAHSTLTKENKKNVPEQFHKSDPEELVAAFNVGELPILIGTSCIATGTDFTSLQCIVYLMGGKSEVKVKQGIGRGTRLAPGKEYCNVWDVKVSNIEKMVDHANARIEIYDDIYGPVEKVRW